MKILSKVCDGADWFSGGIPEIIQAELREPARFHRKQWEFAMIFRVLRECGMLRPDSRGLSMGGGKERLLYALAKHVRQLVVTDLYAPATTWECARTDDPESFIKSDLPFPVDTSGIEALRADMRDLPFENESFDFCYSTCAVEHIGGREDFLKHFDETYRVLREGGIYVFTTEFHYGPETIADQGNYVFSWSYLCDLFLSSRFIPEPVFDARLCEHGVNEPRPSNVHRLFHMGDGHIAGAYAEELPHLQLLRGRHPFTAALFVLRKGKVNTGRVPPRILGVDQSRSFLDQGIRKYNDRLNRVRVSVHPFSLLPEEVSPHCVDHASFFRGRDGVTDNTVFHSDYFWWGAGTRTFRVRLAPSDPGHIELRIHSYKTLGPDPVSSVLEHPLVCEKEAEVLLEVETRDECSYAVLGKLFGTGTRFRSISIESFPSSLAGASSECPDSEDSGASHLPSSGS